MCLIITAVAAILSTLFWNIATKRRQLRLGLLCLMYWGATIMWIVDGFFRISSGEAFFDMSVDDTRLGITIVLCGVGIWGLILIKDFIRNKRVKKSI